MPTFSQWQHKHVKARQVLCLSIGVIHTGNTVEIPQHYLKLTVCRNAPINISHQEMSPSESKCSPSGHSLTSVVRTVTCSLSSCEFCEGRETASHRQTGLKTPIIKCILLTSSACSSTYVFIKMWLNVICTVVVITSVLQWIVGISISQVCTPSKLSGSLQTVCLGALQDWMDCGFGQPSALADVTQNTPANPRVCKSWEVQTVTFSQEMRTFCSPSEPAVETGCCRSGEESWQNLIHRPNMQSAQ